MYNNFCFAKRTFHRTGTFQRQISTVYTS